MTVIVMNYKHEVEILYPNCLQCDDPLPFEHWVRGFCDACFEDVEKFILETSEPIPEPAVAVIPTPIQKEQKTATKVHIPTIKAEDIPAKEEEKTVSEISKTIPKAIKIPVKKDGRILTNVERMQLWEDMKAAHLAQNNIK